MLEKRQQKHGEKKETISLKKDDKKTPTVKGRPQSDNYNDVSIHIAER